MKARTETARASRRFVAAFFLIASACGDEGDEKKPARDTDGVSVPLYAIANEVYTSDGSTTYVNVLTSLDIKAVDYTKAIEYSGGRATIATHGGFLFVAGPEAPVITRFKIADDGSMREDGEVSFADYGFESVVIDDWGNTFVSAEKAYLFNLSDGKTIVWNPASMEIVGEVDQNGHDLVRENQGLNGTPAVVQGNRLFRTVYWNNWEAYTFSYEQYLAVYDVEADKLIELVKEQRCPALGNRVARDEQGNLYFSNWIWNVSATLVNGAPKSCALRIRAGETRFDPSWMLPYDSATEGREAAMFAYLGEGKGLMSVFHDERATIDDDTVPSELASTLNWRLWTLDLDKRTGKPLEGLDWNTGAISTYHLDDRAFLLVPGSDWSVTKIYEVVGDKAEPSFDVQGWSYQFFKVR